MREFEEQPPILKEPEPPEPKTFERDDLKVIFFYDGLVNLSRELSVGFSFQDREEFEAFIKLAQTMPFPED